MTATILYADPDPKATKLAAEALTQAAHRVRLASDSAALEREAADGAESDAVDVAAVRGELGVGVGNSACSTGTAALDFGISVLELDEVVRRAERRALEKALRKADGNRTVAARMIGVSRRTLYNKLEEHHLL